MGTFVKTKIDSNEKIVLNIGAGAVVEKDKDSAINFLESRIKEMEIALKDAIAQKQDVLVRLEQGKQQLNHLMQSSKNKKQ